MRTTCIYSIRVGKHTVLVHEGTSMRFTVVEIAMIFQHSRRLQYWL